MAKKKAAKKTTKPKAPKAAAPKAAAPANGKTREVVLCEGPHNGEVVAINANEREGFTHNGNNYRITGTDTAQFCGVARKPEAHELAE